MKNFLIYLAVALLFLVIESTLFRILLPSLLIPDVILIMTIYLGFHNASIEGVLTTFILGYIADVFSGGIIGLSSFTLILIFLITTGLSKTITLNSMLVKIAGTIFLSIVKGIFTYIALIFLNQAIPFYIIFPIAISTGISSSFIFILLSKIESYFASYKGEDRITNRY
ncbi:MAG: rod shape-determining protein MreD [Deltaproteobacteria bacterium]|nr:rod shape-determining protein MreD [Deltaproteobacteria bacterium]